MDGEAWRTAVHGSQKFGLTEPLKLHSIPVQGTYGCSKDCPCDSHSIQIITDQLPHSSHQPQMFLLCPKWLPQCGISPFLQFTEVQSSSHSLFLLLLSTEFVWFYIYFLVIGYSCSLSWCSARSSVSEVTL